MQFNPREAALKDTVMVTIQAPPPEAVRKFVDELAAKGIKYVRFELPDLHGRRVKKLSG